MFEEYILRIKGKIVHKCFVRKYGGPTNNAQLARRIELSSRYINDEVEATMKNAISVARTIFI